MPPGHSMSSLARISAIGSLPAHQCNGLVDTHHAAHAREDAVHEEIIVRPAGGINGIAHHYDAIVEVARGEHGAGNSHIRRAARNHDRTDAAGAKLKVEI